MKKLKTPFFWALPLLVPLITIHAWEWYLFVSPPPVLSPVNEQGEFIPVGDFTLTTQNNQPWNSQKLNDRVHVVNFFFTACPDICPAMNDRMKVLYDHYSAYDNFRLVSITVDPGKDTPKRLAAYAGGLGVSLPEWTFLTGNRQNIYRIARNEFNVSAAEGDGGETGFIHSELLVLIDSNGLLRGFYDSSSYSEMKWLKKDIDLLLKPL